jgi:glycosyltransferase involved in cell wall biosynthesis
MMRPETTSVIIPVHNGERFVLEAVHSVLGQLDADDEVLVVDDGSTDGTQEALHQCDSRLRILPGRGTGPSAARNLGLLRAGGELIAFLDHDDRWPAGRHAALREILGGQPDVDAAAGRIHVAVEPGGSLGIGGTFHGKHGPSLPWSCLFRRSLIDRAGFFDEGLRYGEYTDYYVRLLEAGMRIGYSDAYSLIYRRHAGNATNTSPLHGAIALQLVRRKMDRLAGKSFADP